MAEWTRVRAQLAEAVSEPAGVVADPKEASITTPNDPRVRWRMFEPVL